MLEEANPARLGLAQSKAEVLISPEVAAGSRSEGFVQFVELSQESSRGLRLCAKEEAMHEGIYLGAVTTVALCRDMVTGTPCPS